MSDGNGKIALAARKRNLMTSIEKVETSKDGNTCGRSHSALVDGIVGLLTDRLCEIESAEAAQADRASDRRANPPVWKQMGQRLVAKAVDIAVLAIVLLVLSALLGRNIVQKLLQVYGG